MTTAVIGATGRVGTEIVRGVLARGEAVTALVRDPGKARRAFGEPGGLHIRPTRLDDPRDLTEAFDGIRTADTRREAADCRSEPVPEINVSQLVPSECLETAAAAVCHTRRRATPNSTRPGKQGVSIPRPVAACLGGYEWRRRSRSQAATSAFWRASARRDCSRARLLALARGWLSVSPAPL